MVVRVALSTMLYALEIKFPQTDVLHYISGTLKPGATLLYFLL